MVETVVEFLAGLPRYLVVAQPYFKALSVLLCCGAVYQVCRFTGDFKDGRNKAMLIGGMGAVGLAVLYALALSKRPSVGVTTVVQVGLWTWFVGTMRAFGRDV